MVIINYSSEYEDSWLRCRLLSFLYTQYYDDVYTEKPKFPHNPSIELIAIEGNQVVGIVDVTIDTSEHKYTGLTNCLSATIETIAVHPDFHHRGIGKKLLKKVLVQLQNNFPEITTLEAWTREDKAANKFYQNNSFNEKEMYYHVYGKPKKERLLQISHAFFVNGFYHVSEEKCLDYFDIDRSYQCHGYLLEKEKTLLW